jgi:hypothetical protein
MSLSNLYFKGCFNGLTDEQKSALEAIGAESAITDQSCNRENKNNCGRSAKELFDLYPIYDPQRGLFNTWGGIPFPWKISDLTENLDFSATDDKWRIGRYKSSVSYFTGDRVIILEKDGYEVVVYEALENIPSISKAFDSTKWERVCSVSTTEPLGLPTIEELQERFEYYSLEFYYKNWDEFTSDWSVDLSSPNSDHWADAKLKKEFFYREGDIVLVNPTCEDALCVYIAIKDIPATQEVYDEYSTFKMGEYWQRIYCVGTGRNKCLEYERKNNLSNYEVVEIGSEGHFVERPIPYALSPQSSLLNEVVELGPEPKVLTQEEIDALEGS